MRVAAAGDISCSYHNPDYNGGRGRAEACRQRATSQLIYRHGYEAVLALGDTQYPMASRKQYRMVYAKSWGRFRHITHPVPGDREYRIPGARDYFAYFGARAGRPGQGYYSFDLAGWHLVALNTELRGERRRRQLRWLEGDLARSGAGCTLAYMHEPRFTFRLRRENPGILPFWKRLHRAGVDVALAADDHAYARFGPLDPYGRPNPERGIASFVVGTGGDNHYRVRHRPMTPGLAVVNDDTFGVLELTLRRGRYDFRFVGVPGSAFTDAGQGRCHRANR